MISHVKHARVALLLLVELPFIAAETAAADDRFGVMTHFAHGWDPALVPLVARSGVAGVRDELYWREIEPEKGTYVFSDHYENTMAALAKNNLSPFTVLSFENDFYDGGNTPYTDDGLAAYARYAVELLRHYGKQIKAVEVWNEYNGGFVKGPAENDRAANYLRMLRTTFAEIKRVRPDVIVVGGATAGVPLPYWEKLLAGGALASMDAVSVHPYRYDVPPEGLEIDLAELSALVAKYNGGKTKPIWVSEIGWQTRPSIAPGDIAIDDNVQAQFLVRAYALLFSANVQRVYWYLFRDYQDFKMGLVRDDAALTQKPAFAAMQAMVQQLRGTRFAAKDNTPRDIYSLRFRRAGGSDVRVMWSLQPRTVAVSGVSGIADIRGENVPFDGTLNLSESPIYVAGAVKGLPLSTETIIGDARAGFSDTQGRNGWSYGFIVDDGAFTPLTTFGADDWHAAWRGEQPYLSITSTDQHPSYQGGIPVASVRRWQSDREGTVHIYGSFRGGKYGGDGLGVSVAVNGERRFRKLLGGGSGKPVAESFDFSESVRVGTTIDFIVDPGPAANIDYDNTAVTASISISTTQ
jgi:hypothetical protein